MFQQLSQLQQLAGAMQGGGGMGGLAGLGGFAAAPAVYRQGWLTKLGFNSGKWQKRFMVLTQGGLAYFASTTQDKEKGRLFIDSRSRCESVVCGCDVEADAKSPSAKLKSHVPEFAFKITTTWKGSGLRTFYMVAESQADCDSWVTEIHNVIAGRPPAGAASGGPAAAAGMAGMAAPAPASSAAAAAAATQRAPERSGPMPADGKVALPVFPDPTVMQKAGATKGANLFDMTKMGLSMLAAVKSHQSDPHLNQTDNALALAGRIQDITGQSSHDEQLIAALKDLEVNHLPPGMAGFVVTEPPGKGTLGEQYGMRVYDLICEVEGEPLKPGCSLQEFGTAKSKAFQSKGNFTLKVYNFVSCGSRVVTIEMPPGKPNAILGLTTSQLPYIATTDAAAATAAGTEDLYVKGWTKQGAMYVSAGANAYPLYDRCTPDNAHVMVEVFRAAGSMMVGTGQYHALYNYKQLDEQLYVEVWRMMGSMMVQSGAKYAPLPMSRE